MPTNWITQIATPAAPKLTAWARMYSPKDTAHPRSKIVVVFELQVNVPIEPGISPQQLIGISFSGVTASQSAAESTPQHSNCKGCQVNTRYFLRKRERNTHSSLHMIPDVDDIPFLVHILLHGAAQTLSHQLLRVIPQDISADSSRQLQDKHNNHKDGECEDHAVILANGSAASEKGNDEDYDPDGDQKSGHGEEVLRKEMTVIMENSLNSRSH